MFKKLFYKKKNEFILQLQKLLTKTNSINSNCQMKKFKN